MVCAIFIYWVCTREMLSKECGYANFFYLFFEYALRLEVMKGTLGSFDVIFLFFGGIFFSW